MHITDSFVGLDEQQKNELLVACMTGDIVKVHLLADRVDYSDLCKADNAILQLLCAYTTEFHVRNFVDSRKLYAKSNKRYQRDWDHDEAMGCAAKYGNINVLSYLWETNGQQDLVYAMMQACIGGSVVALRYLFKAEDKTISQAKLDNVLKFACSCKSLFALEFLVEHGCRISPGCMANACESGKYDMVACIAGAVAESTVVDKTAEYNHGLRVASALGNADVAEMMIDFGATNLPAGMDIAYKNKHYNVMDVLLKYMIVSERKAKVVW